MEAATDTSCSGDEGADEEMEDTLNNKVGGFTTKDVYRFLKFKTFPEECHGKGQRSNFRKACAAFIIIDDNLYHKVHRGKKTTHGRDLETFPTHAKVIESREQQLKLLKNAHEGESTSMEATALSSHRGQKATNDILARRVWWPNLSKDVKEYVRSCVNCQQVSSATLKGKEELHLPIDLMIDDAKESESPDAKGNSLEVDDDLDSCCSNSNIENEEEMLEDVTPDVYGTYVQDSVDDEVGPLKEFVKKHQALKAQVIAKTKTNIRNAQKTQKQEYDARHASGVQYKVGDKVLKMDLRRKSRMGDDTTSDKDTIDLTGPGERDKLPADVVLTTKTSSSKKDIQDYCKMDSSTILVKRFKLEFRAADLQILETNAWLHDNIINFYFNLIKERYTCNDCWKIHVLPTQFFMQLQQKGFEGVERWTKSVDISDMNLLLAPFNILNAHWVMCAIYPQLKKIEFYDSLLNLGDRYMQVLLGYLKSEYRDKKKQELLEHEWSMENISSITKQSDSYQSGVHICAFGRLLAAKQSCLVPESAVHRLRKQMAIEFLHACILPSDFLMYEQV